LTVKHFLLKSQLFVALCAALLGAETYIVAGAGINFVLLAVIFFSSLLIYNFASVKIQLNNHPGYPVSIKGNELHIFLISTSIISLLLLLNFLELVHTIIFLVTGFLSVFYMMPFEINGRRIKGLRNYTLLKNILLSAIWTSATVIMPLAGADPSASAEDLLLLALRRFFFIYSLAVVYDIRDVMADEKTGMITLPVKYGIINTKIIALVSLLIFTLFTVLLPASRQVVLPLLISAVVTAFIILGTARKRGPGYYLFVIDGAMAFQTILVLCFSNSL
jgi:4-hydroxybenzoate polyprenyltransferase